MSAAAEAGLTPTELRIRVLANGWHPLPVVGKAPTPLDWSRYCRTAPTFDELAHWGRSHPAAVSTGLALGHEVGVDIDVASDPVLAGTVRGIALEIFGATPFERVGNAPKTCLVYRAAADVVSSSHKASSGNGDGVDVLADGRQVVGYGRHRDTGLPYTWVGAASPLDARPEAAPVITAAQVDEFLLRVEAVMPLYGGGGPTAGGGHRARGGTSREIVRNASGRVVDGREQFLTSCVWRAANDLHGAKADLTAEAVSKAAWALFADPERGADLSDGVWSEGDALRKARLTLRRVEAGTVDLGASPEDAFAETTGQSIAPTYPSAAVPVEEARAAALAAIEAHFTAATGHRAIRIGTGVGKTRAAVRAIADDIRRRRAEGDKSAALYLTPTLALADEVAELFRSEGVKARTFRGRNAPDPDAPDTGQAMCLDLEAVDAAVALGLAVGKHCCKGEHPKTGTRVFCPLFNHCAYQGQFGGSPDVWTGSHKLLFESHAGLGEIGSVTVDEGFWQSGLKISKRGLTIDELGAPPALGNKFEDFAAADIAVWRSKLAAALRLQEGTGGVERRHLVAGGLDVETCGKAYVAEWGLKGKASLWPGMTKVARQKAIDAAAAAARIGTFTAVWKAALELLEEDEDAVSGRLVLVDKQAEDGFGVVRAVLTHGVQKVKKQRLEAPVLLLDATLPDVEILQRYFPNVEVVASVEAEHPYATVRQVLKAPTSKRKLHGSAAGWNLQAVRRAVLLRWVRAGRPSALVVAQKETAERLREAGLPAGIATGHYGGLAGLDGFKGVKLLIAIGRAMPDVFEAETYAGALTGLAPQRTETPEKGKLRFHDRVALALRMADGSGYPVQGYRHPDPTAEACRWQVAEGGMLQAIGRARAVNRTAENPVALELWNDLALPLTVDEAVRWDNVPAGHEADMIVDGVALESPSDMASCWPTVWATAAAARQWQNRATSVQLPIEKILYKELDACGASNAPPPRPAPFRYQHPGERQKWRRGWYLPDVVGDPCAWLEGRLGTTLARFEYLPDEEADAVGEPATGDAVDHDERHAA